MSSENRDEWSIENLRLATTPLIIAALDMTCSRFSLAFSKVMKGQFIGNDFVAIFDAHTFVPYGKLALENVQAACAVTQRLGLGSSSPAFAGGSSSVSSSASLLVAQARSSPKLLMGLPQQSLVTGTRKRKEAVSDESPVATGKDASDAAKERAARELVMVLPPVCRSEACPGWEDEQALTNALVSSVMQMGVADTIANSRRQLDRLSDWLEVNFSRVHNFSMPPGVLLHFLTVCLTMGKGSELHVPQQVKAGLVFALKLSLDIPIHHPVVEAFCRNNHRIAQSAVSTSVRMFLCYFHFATSTVRGKWAYPFAVRYFATCCMVWCIAAIRSIDCQRAKIIGYGPDGGQHLWVALACWDSKKKRAFVWLCPLVIFGCSSWFDTFKAGMQQNDFMFCEFDCPRGTPLGSVEDRQKPLYKPSTPYMVQKRIRELYLMPRVRVDGMLPDASLEPLMDAEAAASTTRYGHRHFASNLVRTSDASLWPKEVKRQVSHWGSISEMPDRYSQETADLENFKIRVALLDMVWAAVQRTPEHEWPVFGGWHLMSVAILESSKPLTCVEEHQKDLANLDYGSTLAGSDVDSDGEDADGEDAQPQPRSSGMRVTKEVPDGWRRVTRVPESGVMYTVGYEEISSGRKARSIDAILRLAQSGS